MDLDMDLDLAVAGLISSQVHSAREFLATGSVGQVVLGIQFTKLKLDKIVMTRRRSFALAYIARGVATAKRSLVSIRVKGSHR